MAHAIDGTSLDLIWVHLDLTHQRASQLLAVAESKCAERLPGTTMSVNRNQTNTQALVKVTGSGVFVEQLPPVVRSAIIRMYTEDDHDEALAMVTAIAWTGQEV